MVAGWVFLAQGHLSELEQQGVQKIQALSHSLQRVELEVVVAVGGLQAKQEVRLPLDAVLEPPDQVELGAYMAAGLGIMGGLKDVFFVVGDQRMLWKALLVTAAQAQSE